MEGQTFLDSAVAEQLENNFVESRMHIEMDPRFTDLQRALTGSITQPLYLVVSADSISDLDAAILDPKKVKILARQDGATLGSASNFADFLKGTVR